MILLLQHFLTRTIVQNKGCPYLQIGGQLNRWEGLVQEDEKIKTVILTFPDVAGSLSSGGFDGIVINPFCEQPISVDSSMINSITNLDGYKMEFGN